MSCPAVLESPVMNERQQAHIDFYLQQLEYWKGRKQPAKPSHMSRKSEQARQPWGPRACSYVFTVLIPANTRPRGPKSKSLLGKSSTSDNCIAASLFNRRNECDCPVRIA